MCVRGLIINNVNKLYGQHGQKAMRRYVRRCVRWWYGRVWTQTLSRKGTLEAYYHRAYFYVWVLSWSDRRFYQGS